MMQQLYFPAMGMSVASRSGVASVLLMMALPVTALRPASMASGLVVSSDRGTPTTSWTVLTIQSMTSGPAFFWGPMLRSSMSAPWATCLLAMSCMNFLSRFSLAVRTAGDITCMDSPIAFILFPLHYPLTLFSTVYQSKAFRQGQYFQLDRRTVRQLGQRLAPGFPAQDVPLPRQH